MKARYRYLSFRNLLITVLVCVIGFFASEIYLSHASLYFGKRMDEAENNALQYMQIEKIPEKDLNTVAYIADILRSLDPDAVPDTPPTYPLIADMLPPEDRYEKETMNIVVISDSFGWGAGSTNRNELFWRLLENDLRQEGYRCRVYGVCYPGASSYEELSWLMNSTLVEDLSPDLVIFGFVQNDTMLQYDIGKFRQENIIDNTSIPLLFPQLRKLLPNVSARLSNYVIAKRLENDAIPTDEIYIRTDTVPGVAYLKGAVLEQYEKNFLEPLNTYAGQADFPVIIMTLPPYPDNVMQKAIFAPLETALQRYPNIAFYNSLPAFCSHYAAPRHRKNYSVNAVDFHPGSATHRFYADFIERFLKEDYAALMDACKTDVPCDTPFLINDFMPYGIELTNVSETPEALVYTLRYPSGTPHRHFITFDRYFLNSPLGEDYIKLSFSVPAAISSVEVVGEKSSGIDLYYGRIDKKRNYDDYDMIPCRGKTESGVFWTNKKAERITSLYIHCDTASDDGDALTVTIRK